MKISKEMIEKLQLLKAHNVTVEDVARVQQENATPIKSCVEEFQSFFDEFGKKFQNRDQEIEQSQLRFKKVVD